MLSNSANAIHDLLKQTRLAETRVTIYIQLQMPATGLDPNNERNILYAVEKFVSHSLKKESELVIQATDFSL